MNLGLALDDGVQQIDRRHGRLAVIREERDETGVPLVRNLGERGGTRRHEDLPDAIVELLDVLLGDL